MELPSSQDHQSIAAHTPPNNEQQQWSNQAGHVAVQGNQTVYGGQYFNMYANISYDTYGLLTSVVLKLSSTHRSSLARAKSNSVTDSEISFTESEKTCIASLRTDAMYGRGATIHAPLEGTLEWLPQVPMFQSWLSSQGARILLVSGSAGCGKSVLALHVVKSLLGTEVHGSMVCQYFFDGTVASQCNPVILMRNLLHQIVSSHPKLLRIVRKAADAQGHQFFQSFVALSAVFLKLVTQKRLLGIQLILDAIDECEESAQVQIVDWLRHLRDTRPEQSVKILVTSRSGSRAIRAFESSAGTVARFRLEGKSEAVSRDVTKFIQGRILGLKNAGICTPKVAEAIEPLLRDRTDGIFLWASLAVSSLERKRIIKENDVLKMIEQLPRDLMELYDTILSQIPVDDREEVEKALCLISACERPPTISELNVLLNMDMECETAAELREHYFLTSAQSVENLLGALVKVVDSHVLLVHHTLKEYLMAKHPTCQEQSTAAIVRSGESWNLRIAEACVRYLLLQDVAEAFCSDVRSDTISSPTSPVTGEQSHHGEIRDTLDLASLFEEVDQMARNSAESMSRQFDFYDYAAKFWPLHFKRCRLDDTAPIETLALRLYASSGPCSWFKYYATVTGDLHNHPQEPDSLTLSSYFGHHQTTREIMKGQHHEFHLGRACYWAAAMGHTACLAELLSRDCGKVPFTHSGHTCLTIAAQNGHRKCLELLLESGGFDLNEQGPLGRTALSFAAEAGHEDVVDYLLLIPGIDLNLPDSSGASPIFWAVEANSPSILRKIARCEKSNPGASDFKNRNALSWACEAGSAECVKALLDIGLSPDVQDCLGRTPLMYGVQSKSLDVVKRILAYSTTSIGWRDHNGRNAISWAAQSSNSKILAYLLQRHPVGAVVKDIDGWAPIAWTVDGPERPENAALLLPYIVKGLEDGEWVDVFAIALQWRAWNVAKVLIENDSFDINAKGSGNRTAIWHAVASSNFEVMKWVLSREGLVSVFEKGEDQNAYLLVAAQQHQEVRELLIESDFQLPGI